jgi:hypothetical protein
MANNNYLIDFHNITPIWKELLLRSIQLSWNEAWAGILGQKKTNSEKYHQFLKNISFFIPFTPIYFLMQRNLAILAKKYIYGNFVIESRT